MSTSQTSIPLTALRSSVRLSDRYTLAALDAAADTPLLGLADADRPVLLPDTAGHVLVAAGAGGGTTSVLRSLAAQALALGARVDVIDPSNTTQSWTRGLPRVTHLSRIAAIHEHLLLTVAALQDGCANWDGGWPGRHVMVMENTGTIAYGLRQYWLHTRPETQLEEAPGVEALAVLLATGCTFGVQILAGNPRGDIPGLGHVPTHQVFTTRLLAGGPTLWKRVAPEIWASPPGSAIPGRMHLAADGRTTAVQGLYLTDDEARAFARGLPTPRRTA
ncbi:cell division protein FtsK [Streptomyces sp. NPDC101062]|uniref:cell division protein FtsK n=1 Tax=unclassified Streptomyces TaxID=2593676 RepID=UPI0037FFF159